MARRFPRVLFLLLAFIFFSSIVAGTEERSEEERSAEDLAAEDAAAAAVGKQAELEADEDISDALDEDVDAARATVEDPNKHPLSDMPPPSADVDVATLVKGLADDGTMVVGEDYSALVAFANGGRTSFHVWGVMGSLNYDNNWKVYVQNFTYQIVNRTVDSGHDLSLTYKFTPNERLDSRDFRMALSVFYEARNTAGDPIRSHATTFFNQTVKAVAGPVKVDTSSIALLVTLLAALGAGGFYGYKFYIQTDKNVAEVGAAESKANKDEWLAEHHNMIGTRSRARSVSPGRGSKSR